MDPVEKKLGNIEERLDRNEAFTKKLQTSHAANPSSLRELYLVRDDTPNRRTYLPGAGFFIKIDELETDRAKKIELYATREGPPAYEISELMLGDFKDVVFDSSLDSKHRSFRIHLQSIVFMSRSIKSDIASVLVESTD